MKYSTLRSVYFFICHYSLLNLYFYIIPKFGNLEENVGTIIIYMPYVFASNSTNNQLKALTAACSIEFICDSDHQY
jgi:hypothetical protein